MILDDGILHGSIDNLKYRSFRSRRFCPLDLPKSQPMDKTDISLVLLIGPASQLLRQTFGPVQVHNLSVVYPDI